MHNLYKARSLSYRAKAERHQIAPTNRPLSINNLREGASLFQPLPPGETRPEFCIGVRGHDRALETGRRVCHLESSDILPHSPVEVIHAGHKPRAFGLTTAHAGANSRDHPTRMKESSMNPLRRKITFGFGLCLAAAAAIAAAPVRNGLVLYFPTVDLPVRDASGAKNNATASSLMVSNSPSLVSMQQTHQLTYCAWIKPNSVAAFFPDLISKGGNKPGGAFGGYEITLDTSADHDLVFESGNFDAYTGGGLINNNLGQWIHVAFTIDTVAQTVQFYVNGQAVGTSIETGSFSDVNFDLTNNLYIGSRDPAADPNRCNFDGQMRQVMLFNRALSADEVQTIFTKTALKPKPPITK